MAEARHKVDWEEMFRLSMDEEKARRYFESTPPSDRHTCSMCGKMCAVRTTNMSKYPGRKRSKILYRKIKKKNPRSCMVPGTFLSYRI